jgi:cell wall assembly regulator SMI1
VTIESSFKELIILIEQETKAFGLPAGASEQQIAETEQSIGLVFPDQLKALLKMHDGEFAFGSTEYPGLFCDYQFLSLRHIRDAYANVCYFHEFWSCVGGGGIDPNEYRALPADSIRNTGVDLAWLPIAGWFSGNLIGIDLNPGPTGVKGQIINFGRDDYAHFQIAPDLFSFVQLVRDQYAKRRWHSAFGDDSWTSLYDALKQERGDPFSEGSGLPKSKSP